MPRTPGEHCHSAPPWPQPSRHNSMDSLWRKRALNSRNPRDLVSRTHSCCCWRCSRRARWRCRRMPPPCASAGVTAAAAVMLRKPHSACTTSAYVSIRQHTPAYVSIRQHTPAYASIRQHTSAYLRKPHSACTTSSPTLSPHTRPPRAPPLPRGASHSRPSIASL